jgi:hypothetical protein
LIPSDPAAQRDRKLEIRNRFARRNQGLAERFRPLLLEYYGPTRGDAAKHAEAFEICEYGRRPAPAEIRILFPFFGEQVDSR